MGRESRRPRREDRAFNLEEVQALPVPRCRPEDVPLIGIAPMPAEYLQAFVPPRLDADGRSHCLGCGGILYVNWTMVHGEAYCVGCFFPTRLFHYIEGQPRLVVALQYHPDDLRRNERKARR